jgi:hypothetical protein
VQGGAGRQDRCSLSPEQSDSDQVAHGALYGVAISHLSLYLALSEEDRVLAKDEA